MGPEEHASLPPAVPLPTPEAPGRLPWAVLVVEGRRFLVGLVGLALVAGPYRWGPMALFTALFVMRGVHLRLLRFWVTPESFVIERGLLFRKRRVISRARIQAVDLERGLLHRALGLTEVRVEALGGGDTEGALPGVRPEMAALLRERLVPRSPVPPGEEVAEETALPREGPEVPLRPDPPPLLRLPGGEVVVAGLTESRLGAGIAAAWVGLEALRQGAFSGWFGTPEEWVPLLERLPWVAVLVAMGVLVLLFSLLLSFLLTVLGYWGFTLRLRGEVLEVERGLLTQHRDTVPLSRIQAVRVEENPFRRLMGLASVKVVVAGRARSSTASGTNVLLPVGSRREAFRLAARVAGWIPQVSPGEGSLADAHWQAHGAPAAASPLPGGGDRDPVEVPPLHPMPPQARARRRFRAVVGAVLGGLAGPALLHPASGISAGMGSLLPWGWTGGMVLVAGGMALAVGLVGLLLAEAAWRGLGWAELGTHVAFREGVLERKTTLVPLSRLQSVEVVSNPFQRRRGLATLLVPVARPPLESDPRALDLDREVARALRNRILAGARPQGGIGAHGGGSGLSPRPASGMFTC
jgi:putative membrane protein